MNASLKKIWAVLYKDIITEVRTREIIVSVLVFSLLVIIVFSFAFGVNRAVIEAVAPGILWVAFAFAGVLALNRQFIPEKENGCLEGILASPISREALFFGKMLSTTLFLVAVEVIIIPVFALLFDVAVIDPKIILVTIMGTIGFAAVGTLFSALAVNTRAREMVLPVLFLPVVVPVIIAAVKASESALSGGDWGDISSWLLIIGAFDIIFITVPYLIFNYIVEE
ncbi:cytochrome c-type biogenesis protein CcmB [Dehalogenimonas lykanthroporepellens BL-DC-9]|jgi:heme exporter protein B|nr:cytochrome c-type biogenesis protein CcmB [Dehalogenimonas lykanthroporepellens BL-DC-9]